MIKVIIPWHRLRTIAKESADDYLYLIILSSESIPSLEDMLADRGYCSFSGLIDNISELPDFMIKEAQFEVLRPMKLLREHGMKVTKENAHELFATAQVHLPGNELLKIRRVKVRDDCCTDQIQEELDDGWQILAICPQPSRRPDYIMGKP